MSTPDQPVPFQSPMRAQAPASLSTGAAAALLNEVLGNVEFYNDRHIRAEIHAGRLKARRFKENAERMSIRIHPDDFILWAPKVLDAIEMQRLLVRLGR
jgi:hypothetical protein